MSEWKEITAEEYCIRVADGTHDTPKPLDVGEYLITSRHITGGKVNLNDAYRISKVDYDKINIRSKVEIWDVLLTMIGTVGEVVLVDHKPNYAIKNIGLFKCGDELKARWLKYYLQGPMGIAEIQSRIGGTTQEYIALGEMRKLPIRVPPLPEQKAIAGVLSCLDDKIDLLHRQNMTLEAMAETLFRQWFVEEADEGWEEGTVADLIEFNPSRKLSKGTIAPYLEMASLSNTTFSPDSWYEREFSSGTKFVNGDTLLARITPCLENGKTAFITFLEEGQVAWGSTEYIVMRPKGKLHPFFAYILARNRDFRDYAEGCLEGSSGRQRVNVDHLMNYLIKLPDQTAIDEFNSIADSIVPKLHSNSLQIRTLEKLRDTLLPKLMSGEVRVKI